MRRYIAHLRTKPDSHRKRIAFGFSAVITSMLALFWVTSFSYFNSPQSNVEIAKKNSENSPLSVIRKNVASIYESVTGSKIEFVKGQNTTTTATLEYVPESEVKNK